MTFDTMYMATSYENYGDFFPLMPLTNLTEDKAVTKGIVIFLDFPSTKQGQPLADSWSRGLD